MLYALLLVQLPMKHECQLEQQHQVAIRTFLGLPRSLPVGATMGKAQASLLSLQMLRQALLYADRLHKPTEGAALFQCPQDRPSYRTRGGGGGAHAQCTRSW